VKRTAACRVIALALFATALTRSASADVPAGALVPAASTSPETRASALPDAPAPAVGTPLQVRPSAPLVLEPAPAGPGFGWKVFALAIAAGGCGLWLWKKRASSPTDKRVPELRILGRTSAGPRCELLLIELEGQRLLLGVTPQSIQNLYIIADASPEEPGMEIKESASAPAKRAKNAPQGPDAVEGQARGLLSNGERL
jgi:flagellar biogenesis protein FliO